MISASRTSNFIILHVARSTRSSFAAMTTLAEIWLEVWVAISLLASTLNIPRSLQPSHGFAPPFITDANEFDGWERATDKTLSFLLY